MNSNDSANKPNKFHEKKNSISEESKANIQIPQFPKKVAGQGINN